MADVVSLDIDTANKMGFLILLLFYFKILNTNCRSGVVKEKVKVDVPAASRIECG